MDGPLEGSITWFTFAITSQSWSEALNAFISDVRYLLQSKSRLHCTYYNLVQVNQWQFFSRKTPDQTAVIDPNLPNLYYEISQPCITSVEYFHTLKLILHLPQSSQYLQAAAAARYVFDEIKYYSIVHFERTVELVGKRPTGWVFSRHPVMAATCLVWSGRERRRACGAAARHSSHGARRESGGPVCQSAVVPCMVVRMVSQCHRTPSAPRRAAPHCQHHTHTIFLSLSFQCGLTPSYMGRQLEE